ncbi:PDDEXK nuclease domain-containing protein [Neolewinella agarilytica]|uniref:PDDEXK nuclease domain-containing protein n=1 Tax=Neolewinella agarilytica TaxID=478744 RepID=UPI002353B2FE|nr:PDDEXK nuclease domain-containing protein [Neolewinella agarilytica]
MTTAYTSLLSELTTTVRTARVHAIQQVNRSLILMYWELGRQIVESQEEHGWGKGTIKQLSVDLQFAFPEVKSFAPRNLERMRRLYLTYNHLPNATQLVSQVPWGHNVVLLNGKFTDAHRLFYIGKITQYGWTRAILDYHIDAQLYERSILEAPSNNFKDTLPENLIDQANEAIKSSYNLEFLGIEEEIKERELEDRLMDRIRDFILELGYGFTFVGRQYRVTVGDSDFWVDLLFYHRQLQCLVAIDLKVKKFIPEYAGKMNFYLEVLDDTMKLPHENPSIGMILCKEKNDVIVEYSLKSNTRPLGVATYRLFEELPPEMKSKLPTPEQLREQLALEEE